MKYMVPEQNIAILFKRLTKLSAKTVKAGNAPLQFVKTGVVKDEAPETKPNVMVRFVEVEVSAETPAYNGWHFLATICNTDEGNIVRAVPGFTVPANYREGNHRCDHCCTTRRRNDTYVVRHDDGRTLRVGSSCLQDFLQHTSPNKLTLAARICMEAHELAGAAREEGWLGGGGNVYRIDLSTYLAYVAQVVLSTKRYVTRSAARAAGTVSTADTALNCMMHGDSMYAPTEEATTLAESARNWVLGTLNPVELDGTEDSVRAFMLSTGVRRDISDFEHNLYTVARNEVIEPRMAGIAAYVIEAFRRSQPRPEVAQLNGQGLTRIFGMLNAAKEAKLKRPAIRLTDDGGQFLNLSLAPDTSSNPGHIYVKGARTAEGGGDYFGKITPGGKFLGVRGCPSTVEQQLKAFAADPEGVASKYGKLTGHCCFCGRPLTDERSTEVGYGPICADKFQLRWGHSHEIEHAQAA